LCNIVTLVTVFTSASAIYFSHHDIYAAENCHHVGPCAPQAQVFQHSQIDETRRAHTVTIRVGSAGADYIETEPALRRFAPSIGFSDRRPKCANPYFRIHNRTSWNLFES